MSDIDAIRYIDECEYPCRDQVFDHGNELVNNARIRAMEHRHNCLAEIDRLKAEVIQLKSVSTVALACKAEAWATRERQKLRAEIDRLKAERDAMEKVLREIKEMHHIQPTIVLTMVRDCLAQIKGESDGR